MYANCLKCGKSCDFYEVMSGKTNLNWSVPTLEEQIITLQCELYRNSMVLVLLSVAIFIFALIYVSR